MVLYSIDQLVELLKQVQSSLPPPYPDEWVGFRLADDGRVMAGKNIRENPQSYSHVVNIFEPSDEWAKVAEILQVQHKFRQGFTSLSKEDATSFKQKVQETMVPSPSFNQK